MQFPDLYELTLPMLTFAGDGAEWSMRRLVASLAEQFNLSDGHLTAKRGDGKLIFLHRVDRARRCLEKAELVDSLGPQTIKISHAGLRLLATAPQRLGWSYFVADATDHRDAKTASANDECSETLEDELRRLCGAAVQDDWAWDAVRRLNGWGPEPPCTYRGVAKDLGVSVNDLLRLGRACRGTRPEETPLLDAALGFTLSRTNLDPDNLSLELAFAGITSGVITLPGLCEAARRFGRSDEWRELLRYFAAKRKSGQRPRPFESWFELDVFLCLVDLGYHVRPQEKVGSYRVDMMLPDFVPMVVVECDGDAFHGEERRERDEVRERWLQSQGYRVLRFRYSDFTKKPDVIKRGLEETLASLTETGLQLRLGPSHATRVRWIPAKGKRAERRSSPAGGLRSMPRLQSAQLPTPISTPK